jgi:hypothetical protein
MTKQQLQCVRLRFKERKKSFLKKKSEATRSTVIRSLLPKKTPITSNCHKFTLRDNPTSRHPKVKYFTFRHYYSNLETEDSIANKLTERFFVCFQTLFYFQEIIRSNLCNPSQIGLLCDIKPLALTASCGRDYDFIIVLNCRN